ncbi:MAG: response regulator [Alphaproteobacteria bacterium]|nr:response regulator [Alphaproteobacteria bacterium]MBF0250809.1 response regulator [Alphaproteobacteria bacterium]
MKILSVDDDKMMRLLMKKYLSSKGHEVVEAENGEDGVSAARREGPDLIVMDVNMPVMDGYTATRALKADPATRGIPIILLTGADEDTGVAETAEAGADGFLPKPVDFAILLQRIATYDPAS